MNRLVAVDPGKRRLAIALFDNAILQRAWYAPEEKGDGPELLYRVVRHLVVTGLISEFTHCTVAFEWPQAYQGSKQRANPEDLMQLVAIDGMLAFHAFSRGARVVRVDQDEWKKQLDKDQTRLRVINRLSPEELSRVELAGAKSHNVYDACGIGLYVLGRFNPKRVYAR